MEEEEEDEDDEDEDDPLLARLVLLSLKKERKKFRKHPHPTADQILTLFRKLCYNIIPINSFQNTINPDDIIIKDLRYSPPTNLIHL